MNKKITTDLSKLSNIPEECLDKLFKICAYSIGNSVYESILNNEPITEIDLGFGTLIIKANLKDLKLKFIPCEDLELDLKNINQGGEPSLKHKLEKSVIAKLIDMYKELV